VPPRLLTIIGLDNSQANKDYGNTHCKTTQFSQNYACYACYFLLLCCYLSANSVEIYTRNFIALQVEHRHHRAARVRPTYMGNLLRDSVKNYSILRGWQYRRCRISSAAGLEQGTPINRQTFAKIWWHQDHSFRGQDPRLGMHPKIVPAWIREYPTTKVQFFV